MLKYFLVLGSLALVACGGGSANVTVDRPDPPLASNAEGTDASVASHPSWDNTVTSTRDFSSDPRLIGQKTVCTVQLGDGSYGPGHTSVGAELSEPILVPCLASR